MQSSVEQLLVFFFEAGLFEATVGFAVDLGAVDVVVDGDLVATVVDFAVDDLVAGVASLVVVATAVNFVDVAALVGATAVDFVVGAAVDGFTAAIALAFALVDGVATAVAELPRVAAVFGAATAICGASSASFARALVAASSASSAVTSGQLARSGLCSGVAAATAVGFVPRPERTARLITRPSTRPAANTPPTRTFIHHGRGRDAASAPDRSKLDSTEEAAGPTTGAAGGGLATGAEIDRGSGGGTAGPRAGSGGGASGFGSV
jgi:hypothetical protein